jgi:predicted nucleic acid-binding protein
MSVEPTREFVDANVLVYAFDASAGRKKVIAERLLARLWETRAGCVSVQVLQEFFVTVTGKVAKPLSDDEAADRIRELATWKVFRPTADDVLDAIKLHTQARLSFWDAMVVQAAAESGCEVLWTEDLNHGQMLRGVRIRDPFVSEAMKQLDADADESETPETPET